MNRNDYYCIILAGGSGTRLWPLSRQGHPKQFVEVVPGVSFLQKAYERYCNILPQENVIVVTSSRISRLVREQLPSLPQENLFVEPYQRETAPCVAYAAYKAYKRNPDAVCFVAPVDNIIIGEDEFRSGMMAVMDFAASNYALAILGTRPTRPDTNYGYIQGMGGRESMQRSEPVRIKTISEKPYKDVARIFYESGEFLWNTSFYAWSAKTVISEISRRLPLLSNIFNGWQDVFDTPAEAEFLQKAYGSIEKTRIDRGLIEGNDNAWVYPGNFEWTDIGAWDSVYDFLSVKNSDAEGNVFLVEKQFSTDNRGTLIVAPGKCVAVRGLENYVVVDTADTLLICPREEALIKNLIAPVAMPENEKYR